MQILMSGATGFVGQFFLQTLSERLAGAEVHCLSRNATKAGATLSRYPFARAVSWDPMAAKPQEELLDLAGRVDAVIHLAGEPLVGTRLSEEKKKRVVQSRVASTKLLVQAINGAERTPGTFVCASAVGYYGDQPGTKELDESSPPGSDFLADVCKEWEAASAATVGTVRRINCRIGIVLGPGGGALEKMALPIKMFVGGKIGSGRQVVSWISAQDMASALLFCIQTPSLSGPVNCTAPAPVTNAELTKAIGRTLKRPTALPVPKAALSVLFGEGADVLTSGQRVLPRKLLSAGFQFVHPKVDLALKDAMG